MHALTLLPDAARENRFTLFYCSFIDSCGRALSGRVHSSMESRVSDARRFLRLERLSGRINTPRFALNYV